MTGIVVKRKTTVSKNSLLGLLTILIFIISAFANLIMFIGVGAIVFLSIYINARCISKETSIFVPQMVVILLLFQNFSIGIGSHLAGNISNSLSLLTQVPTMFIVISYLFVIYKQKQEKLDIIYFLYVILCLLQMFRTNASYMAKLPYLRNFIIFYMGYVIGKHYVDTPLKIYRFINFFLRLAIIAAIFGLVGIILGKPFFIAIGTLEVYAAKKYTTYINGLPGNFVTIFLGQWVNRLASLYYDPVNFSYFMGLAVLVALIEKKWKLTLFLLICEILTFGKGGLLIFILSSACVLAHRVLKKINGKFVKFLIVVVISGVVLGLVYFIQMFFSDDFGTANHFYGIITGINGIIVNPLGYGIGSAGNLMKTGESVLSEMVVSETGLINMAYQIGIVPTVLFAFILLNTARSTLHNYKCILNDCFLLFTYIPFVLLIVSVFQENTLTPQCIIPYMLFQGAFSNRIDGIEKRTMYETAI